MIHVLRLYSIQSERNPKVVFVIQYPCREIHTPPVQSQSQTLPISRGTVANTLQLVVSHAHSTQYKHSFLPSTIVKWNGLNVIQMAVTL